MDVGFVSLHFLCLAVAKGDMNEEDEESLYGESCSLKCVFNRVKQLSVSLFYSET